ncbi:MAG TPA: flagellar basal body rod protein FlgB [Anaerolineaceae bacterium]|jgi:flagellar basal-body rod protein FlgB|nr:flagellar basal body rod protein FlgB [Anaerolineaceae bacterium]
MARNWISDDALQAARMALDGLSLRQQVISRNLANVDTPGYRAQQVKFEDTLKQVFQRKKGVELEKSHQAHLASPARRVGFQVSQRPGGSLRADLNSVDIDVELLEMNETGIQYQALTQSVSKKLALLKTIASSR